MEQQKHSYFLVVEKDAPAAKVWEEANRLHQEYKAAISKFRAEVGAEDIIIMTSPFGIYVLGVTFGERGGIPEGWRRQQHREYLVPSKKSEKGRALHKRMQELPSGVSVLTMSNLLAEAYGNREFVYNEPGHMWFSTLEYIQAGLGSLIVSVPAGLKVTDLPGCRPLRRSEYYRLIEDAEAEAANVPPSN